MLYKIENSYLDYKKVKVNVQSKKEILETVISSIEKCENIKIVKPKTKKEDLKECKIDYENMEIEVYPNEMAALYALYRLQSKKYELKSKSDISTPSVMEVLNDGRAINASEIVRDFDGWSWNINKKGIEDITVNFLFQTLNTIININSVNKDDIVLGIMDKIELKTGNQTAQKFENLFLKLCIKCIAQEDETEKLRLEKINKKLKNKLDKMSDKKTYLATITEEKKKIQKELAKLEILLNDDYLLRTRFLNTNKLLPPEKKIFSLSDFSEIQEKRKNKLVLELEECNNMQEPKNYIKEKEELKQKIEIIDGLNEKAEEISEDVIEFIKIAIKIVRNLLKKAETKKEIIDLIYKIRYFKKLPVNEIYNVGNIQEISKDIEKLEMEIITAACNFNALNIITPSVKDNYKITKNILDAGIIDLSAIHIIAKETNEKLVIGIYEDKTFEKEIKFNGVPELNIKLNKKIKLFS